MADPVCVHCGVPIMRYPDAGLEAETGHVIFEDEYGFYICDGRPAFLDDRQADATKFHAVDLQEDLRRRWLPSPEQMAAADEVLRTGEHPEGVFTIHLLVNKTFSFWSAEVEVVPVDGVFTDREEAFRAVTAAAEAHHQRHGKQVMGGYAWHSEPGHAAVWDLIGSEFPRGQK